MSQTLSPTYNNESMQIISMLYTVSSNILFNPPETILQKYFSFCKKFITMLRTQ